MFIAFEYMDFYKEGKFQIYKKRKDCPPWQHIVRVSVPCFVEVNFGYHPIVGLYSHKVKTFKEKKLGERKLAASMHNPPDGKELNYVDNGAEGYQYKFTDEIGLPHYCRAIHITEDTNT